MHDGTRLLIICCECEKNVGLTRAMKACGVQMIAAFRFISGVWAEHRVPVRCGASPMALLNGFSREDEPVAGGLCFTET